MFSNEGFIVTQKQLFCTCCVILLLYGIIMVHVYFQKLPPVRNSLDKKKKKKVKKKSDKEPATKPKKIRGYDYRSWDKFDVVS